MKRYFITIILLLIILTYYNNIFAQNSFSMNEVKQLMMKGDYIKLIDEAKKILKRDSTNFELLYNLGLAHQNLFQYDKAKEILYKAYEYEKFNIPLLITLGRNYKYMGAGNYAVMFFEQAYAIDTTDINIKLELANAYLDSFDFVNAEKMFSKLLEADTTNGYICKQLAYCNFKLGQEDKSIELYTKAQTLNEFDATIPIQLGNLLVRKEKYEDAFHVVKRGLIENGQNSHLNRLAAEILFKLKRYQAAQFQYERLINNGDSTSVHYQRLGFCYYITATDTSLANDSTKVDKIKKAVYAFGKAVELDDNDALAWMYLGLSYKELSDYEKSNECISCSISKMIPGYLADAYSHMANNYELIGNYDKSIKAYRKAAEYNPGNANLTFQLAALYDKYYEDKNVPLMYYKKYLRDNKSNDEIIIEYIKGRIEKLEEYLHFRM